MSLTFPISQPFFPIPTLKTLKIRYLPTLIEIIYYKYYYNTDNIYNIFLPNSHLSNKHEV
jgi:hypothetical protein